MQESEIVRVTPKRAYLAGVGGDWFALDDPKRVVKPRYLGYITTVVELMDPEKEGTE